jgi:hypothetical protein
MKEAFKDTDAATVFDEVSKRTESEEARSLWDRLLSELERKGVNPPSKASGATCER